MSSIFHTVTVEDLEGIGHFAECYDCEFVGPFRPTEVEAKADASKHERDQRVNWRPQA